MSFPGNNPKSVTYKYIPQNADPTSPQDGDVFYSDGTPRDEGLWLWTMGAWSQISTGATLSVLDNLTLTPQSADPGSPTEGMLFMSDGTVRTEGLWQYVNGAWSQLSGKRYQEFTLKEPVEVRLATTANITLASQLENGDTIDSVVLATSDLVLVKNQTTASENGVYVVAASGAPTRYTGLDSADELNSAIVYVGFGTTQRNTFWYQTATLTSLSDPQTWTQTQPSTTATFTVPEGVYELDVELCAGGGGGGGSAYSLNSGNGAGGGGGGGSIPKFLSQKTTPGETVSIKVGAGGLPARSRSSTSATYSGDSAGDGGDTVVTFNTSTKTYTVNGATKGGSASISANASVHGVGASGTGYFNEDFGTGGNGGSQSEALSSTAGQGNLFGDAGTNTAASTNGGSGAGGRQSGGASGINGDTGPVSPVAGSGAGGGGGGRKTTPDRGSRSGWGGSGYVRFSWK